MPMSSAFKDRLFPALKEIADHYGTPFHIYDEAGIRDTGRAIKDAFASAAGFQEFYAVKALPNPVILEIMKSMGFGFDCSSITELMLSRRVGAAPDDIMFTSNNTSREEFLAAEAEGGSLLNLDDISLLPKVPRLPELICFRYNPGPRRTGNEIIGNPVEAKYGVSHEQIVDAYRTAREMGARRFGLHTMLASNERNHAYMVQTAEMLLSLIEEIHAETGITFEFINIGGGLGIPCHGDDVEGRIGGGLGIPYHPEDPPLDIVAMAGGITRSLDRFRAKHGYAPKLCMESGRYMTGPHGVLVTAAINRKEIYRTYVGVDACMSALMRPGMYGAYHHIDVLGKNIAAGTEVVDVVGSLCENNDKFAVQRPLPPIEDGDLLVIHDTGAHGHAMGFNYNGKLRPQEILLRADGTTERIRRAESPEDYFATLEFAPDRFHP